MIEVVDQKKADGRWETVDGQTVSQENQNIEGNGHYIENQRSTIHDSRSTSHDLRSGRRIFMYLFCLAYFLTCVNYLRSQTEDGAPFDAVYGAESVRGELSSYVSKKEWVKFRKKLASLYDNLAGKVAASARDGNIRYALYEEWIARLIVNLGADAINNYRLEFDHIFNNEMERSLASGKLDKASYLINRYAICSKAPEFVLRATNVFIEEGRLLQAMLLLNKVITLYPWRIYPLLDVGDKQEGILGVLKRRVSMARDSFDFNLSHPQSSYPNEELPSALKFDVYGSGRVPLNTTCFYQELGEDTRLLKNVISMSYVDNQSGLMMVNNGSGIVILDLARIAGKSAFNKLPKQVCEIDVFNRDFRFSTSTARSEVPFLMGGFIHNDLMLFNALRKADVSPNVYLGQTLYCYKIKGKGYKFSVEKLWDFEQKVPAELAGSRLIFIPPFVRRGNSVYSLLLSGKPRRWNNIDLYDLHVMCADIKTGSVRWLKLLERCSGAGASSSVVPALAEGAQFLSSLVSIDGLIYAITPSRSIFILSEEGTLVDFATIYSNSRRPRSASATGYEPFLKWTLKGRAFYFVSRDDEGIVRIPLHNMEHEEVFDRTPRIAGLVSSDDKKAVFIGVSGALSFVERKADAVKAYADDLLQLRGSFCFPGTEKFIYCVGRDNTLMGIDLTDFTIRSSDQLVGAPPYSVSFYSGLIVVLSNGSVQILRNIESELGLVESELNLEASPDLLAYRSRLLNEVFSLPIRELPAEKLGHFVEGFTDGHRMLSSLGLPVKSDNFARFILDSMMIGNKEFDDDVIDVALQSSSNNELRLKVVSAVIEKRVKRTDLRSIYLRFLGSYYYLLSLIY